ncbi:MAG: thiamine ABC transporter substrate-binding protein [Anaerolineales bacterium]|nr:thiamine ABC transporter substrate-binding protein [Anaerolineales bacterium]
MPGKFQKSIVLFLLLLTACTPQTPAAPPTSAGPQTLTVMTHDSFAISETALQAFEEQNQAKVQFLKAGDTGTSLNKAILSKDNPLADVFYGVDNTFLSRALDEGIFQPYASPLLSNIPDEFKLDPDNFVSPVDYGDVCLNYDKAYFAEKGLTPPQSLDDLLKPEYKSLLVVENPATSSPGLAFLLTTLAVYGEDGYIDFWQKLVENDVKVVNDWELAYYTEFSGSSGKGPRPIVVSYDSSPAYEVMYAETEVSEPPTAAVVADNTCFRQIEFVGILKGAKNPHLAQKWEDFMLSQQFQQELPMQMFVFPVNTNAVLEDVFGNYLLLPTKTVFISPEDITARRQSWLEAWTEAVLR